MRRAWLVLPKFSHQAMAREYVRCIPAGRLGGTFYSAIN
jgi:hypothetical protein